MKGSVISLGGQRIRRIAFSAVDRIRAHPYAVQLDALEDYFSGRSVTSRRSVLQRQLSRALAEVPFYRGLRPLPDPGNLETFPVLRKRDVRARWKDFRSERIRGALRIVHTSGSHGEPFRTIHGSRKQARKLADLLYFNRLFGYEIGVPHLLIRATPKSRFRQFAQNEVWIDPSVLDDVFYRRMDRALRRKRPQVVIGYPTAVAAYVRWAEARHTSAGMKAVRAMIATSEGLSERDRLDISSGFGCVVVSRYATEEFGVLAHQLEMGAEHVVNDASFVIEILNEEGAPVARGQPGRVVVTDLYNDAFPLVRYDTGDIALAGSVMGDGLGVRSIMAIEGKAIETIRNVLGTVVSPHAVMVGMKNEAEISSFQFIQTGPRDYILLYTSVNSVSGEAKDRIFARLRRAVGKDACIDVRRVEVIPALPSGKRPIVRNLMNTPAHA